MWPRRKILSTLLESLWKMLSYGTFKFQIVFGARFADALSWALQTLKLKQTPYPVTLVWDICHTLLITANNLVELFCSVFEKHMFAWNYAVAWCNTHFPSYYILFTPITSRFVANIDKSIFSILIWYSSPCCITLVIGCGSPVEGNNYAELA